MTVTRVLPPAKGLLRWWVKMAWTVMAKVKIDVMTVLQTQVHQLGSAGIAVGAKEAHTAYGESTVDVAPPCSVDATVADQYQEDDGEDKLADSPNV